MAKVIGAAEMIEVLQGGCLELRGLLEAAGFDEDWQESIEDRLADVEMALDDLNYLFRGVDPEKDVQYRAVDGHIEERVRPDWQPRGRAPQPANRPQTR